MIVINKGLMYKCECCGESKAPNDNQMCQECYEEIDRATVEFEMEMYLESQCGHDLWLLGGNDYDV